jgi:hypothetical protein
VIPRKLKHHVENKATTEQQETGVENPVEEGTKTMENIIPDEQEPITAQQLLSKGEITESESAKLDKLEQIVRAEGLPVGEKPTQQQQQIILAEQKIPEDLEDYYRGYVKFILAKEGTLHNLIAKQAQLEKKDYDKKLDELISIFAGTQPKDVTGEIIRAFDGITDRLTKFGINADTVMTFLKNSKKNEPSEFDKLAHAIGTRKIESMIDGVGKEDQGLRYAYQALDNAIGGFNKGFYGYMGKKRAQQRLKEEAD